MMEIIDFETFAAQHGHDRFAMDVAVQRLPGASVGRKKRIIDRELSKITENARCREELREEYNNLVMSGKVRSPTHIETIIAASLGNPESEQTKAAKRVLEKRNKKMIKRKIIRTETEYEQALARVDELMDAVHGSQDEKELEALAMLIEEYEEKNFPI